jgi:hypothetical protein
MPGMNGVDLADRLNECKPVKVPLISGNPDEVISVEGLSREALIFCRSRSPPQRSWNGSKPLLIGSEGPQINDEVEVTRKADWRRWPGSQGP